MKIGVMMIDNLGMLRVVYLTLTAGQEETIARGKVGLSGVTLTTAAGNVVDVWIEEDQP